MKPTCKAIGFIPARGGSKGIPRKNLYPLCGKPLIEYSITAGRESCLSKVFVSTDDAEIARVAKELGAEVPFLRNPEIARDASSINDAILELLEALKLEQKPLPDAIVVLQPTSPLRQSFHIDEALALLEKSKNDYVIALSPPLESPYDMVHVLEGGGIEFLMKKDVKPGITQRQAHQQCYFINGAIYAFRTSAFLKTRSMFSPQMTPYFMAAEDSIDIDTPAHMKIAGLLLKNRS